MTTPPKAPCHYCNGTGIDPTVDFLDCEFCSPAWAEVSPLAPKQPEPKCETCNDHGEIGCLRPDGYDGERCPDCNPAADTFKSAKPVRNKVLAALKPAEGGSTCNQIREETGLPINRPCKACNGGSCIDR